MSGLSLLCIDCYNCFSLPVLEREDVARIAFLCGWLLHLNVLPIKEDHCYLLVRAAKRSCSLVTSRTQHILAMQESCSEAGHKLILVLTLIKKISKK